jgi:hypothetical protein
MKDNALYLEVDEDITSAIDKLTKAPGDSVQIVVPKRSTMLQSIINLKLLKKAAESNGKDLVLVTGDRVATDLAGRVGLAVASSVGAKPVIVDTEMPAELKSNEEIIESDDPEPPVNKPEKVKKSAKELFIKHKEVSPGPPVPPPLPEPDPEPTAAADVAASATKPKGPKVPNFNRLQRRVMWAGLAVVLVAGYAGYMALGTSAKVVLYANGTKVDIDTTYSVDPNLSQTDKDKAVLAGQLVTVSKDLSGPFTPTGKKDVGTKSSGTITIYNCFDANTHNFVTGTRFQAPDGKIFRSTADVSVPGGSGTFFGCTTPGTATVNVQADQNGDSYNEGPATYTLPGLSATQQTGQNSISAKGGQMSGGTSKIATVVTQSDVDSAKTDLVDKDKDNAARDLKGRVPSGYLAIDSSTATATSDISPAPAVNAEGSTATLSVKVTYTVLAVKESDYRGMLEAQEQKQVGDQNQIYDDGLDGAQVTAGDKDSNGRQNFHLTTEAYSGTKLDVAAIANQLKGKKYGDANDLAGRQPGVSHAEVTLTPGWATNLPNRADKIHVKIQVASKQ